MNELRDRVAVITGAASGLGLALAQRAAAEGMRLALADIDLPRLRAVAADLDLPADRLLSLRVDVSQEQDIAGLAAAVRARYGAVHLLCNNAGVALTRLISEMSRADWEWVLGVNLWSVIHGVQHFLPIMTAQAEASHLVNTASAAGMLSTPASAAYNVAKHGVVTLSETLYHELRATAPQVGVSLLCPAWVKTGINQAARNRPQRYGVAQPAGEFSAAYEERIAQALDAGRLSAKDIADAVFAAVAERRFYVIPHRRINQAFDLRFQDILLTRNPTPLE